MLILKLTHPHHHKYICVLVGRSCMFVHVHTREFIICLYISIAINNLKKFPGEIHFPFLGEIRKKDQNLISIRFPLEKFV